jgi:hypothetical protein
VATTPGGDADAIAVARAAKHASRASSGAGIRRRLDVLVDAAARFAERESDFFDCLREKTSHRQSILCAEGSSDHVRAILRELGAIDDRAYE